MIEEQETIRQVPRFRELIAKISELEPAGLLNVRGVNGSFDAFLLAGIRQSTGRQVVMIARDRLTASRVIDDLGLLLGSGVSFHFGAGRDADKSRKVEDIESLNALLKGNAHVVVSSPESIIAQLPDPSVLTRLLVEVRTGTAQRPEELVAILDAHGFERRDFVESIGNYATRGGIIDVFPFVGDNPIRIEFDGDVVESLREFDPLSQRSIRELTAASIIPDLLSGEKENNSGSLFSYLRPDALVVLDEPSLHRYPGPDGSPRWNQDDIARFVADHQRIILSGHREETSLDFDSLPQPAFNGSIRFFREHVLTLLKNGTRVIIGCDGHAEENRLRDLLTEAVGTDSGMVPETEARALLSSLKFNHQTIHEGFELQTDRLAWLTEHQIFARRKRVGRRRVSSRRKGLSQSEVRQLRKGDYVVHSDYGIGTFDGLQTMSVGGIHHDVLKVTYEGGDTLYVNLNYVNRVQKYSSREGHVPKLNRLGSAEWQKLKARAKGRIKDIARDLIRLYSQRKSLEGFAFQADTAWQKELEASFVFEDTFDQARATLEVKADMEAPSPMDRLICGDVGFGKTEVAVRAAFKAVMDGKQVAILVPTTILAVQHLNTFSDRLSRYSVRVEALSRLKPKAEQKAILAKVSDGTIDIIIGTHRLLSKDVAFKDLGLLVIDEEHRFGVSAKEKLRQKKATVDTLTLTATPIPRTLHFSLMGARDLSVINTPPRNRLPIITEIVEFKDDYLRDAILREVQRGGQVYVVHDRVQDIGEFTNRLSAIVPGTRIAFAHGQMNPRELEDVMIRFLERQLDVLVCTKIIESGLDIPNVNTILINRADRFGMAELYQLRGRVGRSNVQAFALLIAPPLASLPRESMKRLSAMQEFTELGTGFHLAMRDLEIRGAGNLLGSEQSGYITDMGFETYTRILEEAVSEIKESEFSDMFGKSRVAVPEETLVEVDVEALIPSTYIQNSDARLEVYRRLYGVTSTEQVLEIGDELRDRFGSLPTEASNLLEVLKLRLEASALGCRRVKVHDGFLDIEITPDAAVWNDDRAGQFVSSLARLRKPVVRVMDLAGGVRLRVSIEHDGEPLRSAASSLRSISHLLTGIRRMVPAQTAT